MIRIESFISKLDVILSAGVQWLNQIMTCSQPSTEIAVMTCTRFYTFRTFHCAASAVLCCHVNVRRTRWTSIGRPKLSPRRPVTPTGQPQRSRGRPLGGRSRNNFDRSPLIWRPGDVQAIFCSRQSKRSPSATATLTLYEQEVGRSQAVRNRELTFPYSSQCRGFNKSERCRSVTRPWHITHTVPKSYCAVQISCLNNIQICTSVSRCVNGSCASCLRRLFIDYLDK